MTWFLLGFITASILIALYVIVKGSQGDNQAVSLELTADEPTLKE